MWDSEIKKNSLELKNSPELKKSFFHVWNQVKKKLAEDFFFCKADFSYFFLMLKFLTSNTFFHEKIFPQVTRKKFIFFFDWCFCIIKCATEWKKFLQVVKKVFCKPFMCDLTHVDHNEHKCNTTSCCSCCFFSLKNWKIQKKSFPMCVSKI